MRHTLVVVVKQRLVELLSGNPALAEVDVTYGHPGSTAQRVSVWTGHVATATMEAARMSGPGSGWRETVEFVVGVTVAASADVEKNEIRAVELAGVVHQTLAEQPCLGVAGVISVRVTGWEMLTRSQSDRAPETAIEMRISVEGNV